jgi:hypothetical protein
MDCTSGEKMSVVLSSSFDDDESFSLIGYWLILRYLKKASKIPKD